MSPQLPLPLPRFFSRNSAVTKTRNFLPHWDQRGCACFATWRTLDSIPQAKLEQIRGEREDFARAHPEPWSDDVRDEYAKLFEGRYQKWQDEGWGEGLLRRAPLRQSVLDVILRFDRIRYVVYGAVVMPNHVHVLFMPLGDASFAGVPKGWKGVSSRAVNVAIGRTGPFWQKESWDHLVRSAAQFRRFLRYIRDNDPMSAYDAYGAEASCNGEARGA